MEGMILDFVSCLGRFQSRRGGTFPYTDDHEARWVVIKVRVREGRINFKQGKMAMKVGIRNRELSQVKGNGKSINPDVERACIFRDCLSVI